MKPDHFRSVLQSLIDDQRLSRSDRRALSALLDQHPPSDAQRAELRHLAFDVARQELIRLLRLLG